MNLTDREFLGSLLNTSLPGLEGIPPAMARDDIPSARRLFAAHIRRTLDPERFFAIPRNYDADVYRLPGETHLQAAGRICAGNLISCGTPHQFGGEVDWSANPTYNRYAEWTWQLNRHYEFYSLAMAYRQTGGDQYAVCFAVLLQSWLAQADAPAGADGWSTLCWRTIEAGIRMSATWPAAIHAFVHHPAFTDELLTDCFKSVWQHGQRLSRDYTHGNWLIMEMSGLAAIGLLYPVFREKWLDFALDKLAAETAVQIYPDGFQYELSPGYHEVVLGHYFEAARLLKGYHAERDLTGPLENAAALYLKLLTPDGRLPAINDSGWERAAPYFAAKLDFYPRRRDFLWAASEGAEGERPDYLSAVLPYSGLAVMRSGWERDAFWALLDAGPFGRGHQHEDKLNFLLYAGGRQLITEGGIYAYDDSEMRRYALSTRAHNTVRVNGLDQNRRKNYQWRPEDIRKPAGIGFTVTGAYETAEGVYDEGYGPEAAKMAVHRRRVFFLKRPGWGLSPFFILIDRLTAQQTNRYELLWHFAGEGVTLEGARFAADHLTGWVAGKQARARLIRGQTEPEWQGFAANSALQGDYSPVYTGQFTAEGGNVTLATLFYPGETGACPIRDFAMGETDRDLILSLGGGERLRFNEETCQFE